LDDERELLLRLLEKEGLGPVKAPATDGAAHAQSSTSEETSSTRPSIFPLAYPQEHLWFLQRFEPEGNFYNVLDVWRMQGDLDVLWLEACLERGGPASRNPPHMSCPGRGRPTEAESYPRESPGLIASGRSEWHRRKRKIRTSQADCIGGRHKNIRPEQLPLLRGVLVHLGEKDHILGLSMHHIICDEWSTRVLMDEWGGLYQAYTKNQESPLPEPRLQYGDYALEQRRWMQGEKFQRQMDYWKQQLDGMPHVLELPTDFTRPRQQTFRGDTETSNFSAGLLEGLNAIGRQERTSLFMTLLAAFEILLMRYNRQEDFGVGIPVANRRRRETEGLIGFCLNTLVMRANLEDALLTMIEGMDEGAVSRMENT
jgi:hypothetical protein